MACSRTRAAFSRRRCISKPTSDISSKALIKPTVVVNGRHSQEGHANAMSRRRLVLTRQVADLAPDPDNPKARLWNPAGASFEAACAALGLNSGDGRRHWRPAGLHPVPQAGLRLLSSEPRDQSAPAGRHAGLQPREVWRRPRRDAVGRRPQSSAAGLARRRADPDRLGCGNRRPASHLVSSRVRQTTPSD